EDNVYSLAPTSACDVIQGGRDETARMSKNPALDLDGIERTAIVTCTPTVADAAGWSMGAYERD
ncbi:MAG: hypothetical protein AAF658_06230, partial [Myxococcota bacterium]